jgi:undecaprenyl pyrophosphate phosphatase UppP
LIAGAALFEGVRLRGEVLPSGFVTLLGVGAVVSAATSVAAVWVVLAIVRRRSFAPFVAYRLAAGIAVLVAVAVR